MKKALDQTVRELKREVNKKVLNVPGIEQKILDATSNEPWGPHGSLLADIAQATRNYQEYQMIMAVIWKRINDTGKNWRHVYKALTVLEYLVAHGSERVIDEIREHAYQISTLSDFQYIDSSGRDQGSNVRRKSQTLVALVNDKEKIQEARQKALANRDKYRGSFSTGGLYRPGSYSSHGGHGDHYDDDRPEGRYSTRDEYQNGNGRERDWGYRDDDRYGRSDFNRDGDRYSRSSDERYGRDSREDDYRGSRGDDDYRFGSTNRSFDRDRRSPDDDSFSARGSGARGDESYLDERRLAHKLSEQSVNAPSSYEEALSNAHNRMQEERSRAEGIADTTAKASSSAAPSVTASEIVNQVPDHTVPVTVSGPKNEVVDAFDEFDPRGSQSVPPTASGSSEVDLFGASAASEPVSSLALVSVTSLTTSEVDPPSKSGLESNFIPLSFASNVFDQPAENPFGDAPFKATPVPQENVPAQQKNYPNPTTLQPSGSVGSGSLSTSAPKAEVIPGFDFGDSLDGITYTPTAARIQHSTFVTTDVPVSHISDYIGHLPQAGNTSLISTQQTQVGNLASPTNVAMTNPNVLPQTASPTPLNSQAVLFSSQTAPTNPLTPAAPNIPQSSIVLSSSTQAVPSTASITPAKAQSSKDKFETKSAVWTDTLNRGLVNLNISGSKINPLADIGIDFDSINRMEKRKEKSSATTTTSATSMGKAMGSGSGIGRAGVGGLAPSPSSTMGSGSAMGMGRGVGIGGVPTIGMGAYGGGMNQPTGIGMGGMALGTNMGMGQTVPMRPAYGAPPGMPGLGYNPTMGMGSYNQQQSYGGYR